MSRVSFTAVSSSRRPRATQSSLEMSVSSESRARSPLNVVLLEKPRRQVGVERLGFQRGELDEVVPRLLGGRDGRRASSGDQPPTQHSAWIPMRFVVIDRS